MYKNISDYEANHFYFILCRKELKRMQVCLLSYMYMNNCWVIGSTQENIHYLVIVTLLYVYMYMQIYNTLNSWCCSGFIICYMYMECLQTAGT